MEKLRQLYTLFSKDTDFTISALPSSGGNRRYYRIEGSGESHIGVCGSDLQENRTFIAMAEHFLANGLPVPQIYAIAEDYSCYIQQDLGNTSLFDAVAQGRKSGQYNASERELIKSAVRLLPAFQYCGAAGFDFDICYPVKEFDRVSVMFDLHYFKYCFLKTLPIDFDEIRLEKDFEYLCDRLLMSNCDAFQYRDYQSRNIMIHDGALYGIDFQGGRRGPAAYDLASFVWQAKAGYPAELKQELLEIYIDAASEYKVIDCKGFMSEYRQFVLFRTLQVLGAYGFRGKFERRPHFLESIPLAIANLREIMSAPFDEYPYLCEILQKIIDVHSQNKTAEQEEGLHIEIYSFSYKRGFPEDRSGNGGGYVFDCRGLPNPGRLAQYKSSTGMDSDVQEYLEQYPQTAEFAALTAQLADSHVENYLERGFNHLMFCFGCTGGQHRSVFFAEKLAAHLRSKFPQIRITLAHREQNITKEL